MQLARPKDMIDAIWLARLHEDKLNDQFHVFKPSSNTQSTPSSYSIGPLQFSKLHVSNNSSQLSNYIKNFSSLHIKRL